MAQVGEGKVLEVIGDGSFWIEVAGSKIVAWDNCSPRLNLRPGDLVTVIAAKSFQAGARIVGLAGTSDGSDPNASGGVFDQSYFDGEDVFK